MNKSPCWWPATEHSRRQLLPVAGAVGPAGGIIEPEACRAGDAASRNSVSAAWQHWRLGVEGRALLVGRVFCQAHGRRLPAAFLPGQRTAYAVAEEFGWVSVRGAGRSPGFRARGVAAKAVGHRGSRVNSGWSVLPGAWPETPRRFPAGPASSLRRGRGIWMGLAWRGLSIPGLSCARRGCEGGWAARIAR